VCGCGLYSLRHSFATRLVEEGTSIRTVSEALGHKDVTTTIESYLHATPEMAKQAVAELSKAMYG
jgi:site-specific recombinase XerD